MHPVTEGSVALSEVQCNRLLEILFKNNPKEVKNALAILHQEQQQQQQQPIYGVEPSSLETIVDSIVDIMASDDRAKRSLKEVGRGRLVKVKNGNISDLSFGCLGEHCCDLVNQDDDHHSEHTLLFKAALQAKVDETNPEAQLAKFLAMLIRFAHEKGDVKVTQMLTFFLTETILRLRVKPPGLYSKLFSELMSKGLISDSDRRVPALSEGNGRHNNKKKTPAMKKNDEQFTANSIKYIIECLIIKSHCHHQQAALAVVDHVAYRDPNDVNFGTPSTGLNWWKSSFCYDDNIISMVPTAAGASTYSLEDALNGCSLSLSDARPEFGSNDNAVTFNQHGLVCCFANTRWRVVDRFVRGGNIDAYFAHNPRPETDAEKALAGLFYKISDFEILDYLGGGRFGKVVLARLKSNPAQQFALKLLSVDLVTNEVDLQYLVREIVETSKVMSAHTAKVLGYFAVPELVLNSDSKYKYTVAIMMEYCGSATLRTHITSQELKQMTPSSIFFGLVEGGVLSTMLPIHASYVPK